MAKNSKFLTLNQKDFVKGLVVAMLTALLMAAQDWIERGEFNFDMIMLKKVGISALVAGIAYLSKNLVTNQNDQLLKK